MENKQYPYHLVYFRQGKAQTIFGFDSVIKAMEKRGVFVDQCSYDDAAFYVFEAPRLGGHYRNPREQTDALYRYYDHEFENIAGTDAWKRQKLEKEKARQNQVEARWRQKIKADRESKHKEFWSFRNRKPKPVDTTPQTYQELMEDMSELTGGGISYVFANAQRLRGAPSAFEAQQIQLYGN